MKLYFRDKDEPIVYDSDCHLEWATVNLASANIGVILFIRFVRKLNLRLSNATTKIRRSYCLRC